MANGADLINIASIGVDLSHLVNDIKTANNMLSGLGKDVDIGKNFQTYVKQVQKNVQTTAQQVKKLQKVFQGIKPQDFITTTMQSTKNIAQMAQKINELTGAIQQMGGFIVSSTETKSLQQLEGRLSGISVAYEELNKKVNELKNNGGTGNVSAGMKDFESVIRGISGNIEQILTKMNTDATQTSNTISNSASDSMSRVSQTVHTTTQQVENLNAAAQNASDVIGKISGKSESSGQENNIKQLTNAYVMLMNAQSKAIQIATTNGNIASSSQYAKLANIITDLTQLWDGLDESVRKQVLAQEDAIRAGRDYQAVLVASQIKSNQNSIIANDLDNIQKASIAWMEYAQALKIVSTAQKDSVEYNNAMKSMKDNEQILQSIPSLQKLVDLYKDYYESKKKAQEANNTTDSTYYEDRAKSLMDEIKKYDEAMRTIAQSQRSVMDAEQKYNESVSKNGTKQIDDLVKKYQEYYALLVKAQSYKQKGQTDNAAIYTQLAESKKAQIETITSLNSALDQQAKKRKEVITAQSAYQAAKNTTQSKSTEQYNKQLEDTLKLFQKLKAKETQLKTLELTGKTDSTQYAKTEAQLNKIQQSYNKIDQSIRNVVEASSEATKITEDQAKILSAVDKNNSYKAQEEQVSKLIGLYVSWYSELQKVQRLKASGKTDDANLRQQNADSIRAQIDAIAEGNDALRQQAQMSDKVKQKKIDYYQAINDAAETSRTAQKKAIDDATKIYEDMLKAQARQLEMEQTGKKDTTKYAQITAQVTNIQSEWNKVDDAIKRVVVDSERGKVALKAQEDAISNIAAQQKKAADESFSKDVEKALPIYEKLTQYLQRKKELQISNNTQTNEYIDVVKNIKNLQESWNGVNKSVQDYIINSSRAQNEVNAASQKESLAKQTQQIEKAADAWVKYYNAKSGLVNSQFGSEQYFNFKQEYEDAKNTLFNGVSQSARNAALEVDRVTAAVSKFNNAQAKSDDKALSDQIKEYAQSLVALNNEKTKLNNELASGNIKKGSAQYNEAIKSINNLSAASEKAGSSLSAVDKQAATSMPNVAKSVNELNESTTRLAQNQTLSEVSEKYKQLSTAIKNYKLADRSGNETQKTYWQNQINGISQYIASIESNLPNLDIEQSKRQQILNIIEQSKNAIEGMNAPVQQHSNELSMIFTRYLSLYTIINSIKKVLSSAVDYVSEFYDKMNEIQIITQKTDSEISSLATTYRDLASQLNVSSNDIADAAIYFTRQGLAAEEINQRLVYTTQYAKTANIEFNTAAELITAVVNSMGLVSEEAEDGRNAAQRVADVFLLVGDSAATSGQEIGEAMQKASAAAGQFGLSFEWLAAYIASVSETTRQEASTIGTAFNTLIARLHSIKQKGYNDEDETKVNDIAKALAKVDIVLMDQNNNWRDMSDIFVQIAGKWGSLDDKTKSYIATTMAGTKQQNVFLALMGDMSKGAEGGSRAFELYEKAINSAGTASEKYSTYLDSVTAAQDRLTIASEKFYSALDASVIKGFYDTLSSIVNVMADGTQATNGINIALTALIATITALSISAHNAHGVLAMLSAHPIVLAIGASVALGVAITSIAAHFSDAKKKIQDYNSALDFLEKSQQRMTNLLDIQKSAFTMFDQVNKTGKSIQEYDGTLQKLCSISPAANEAVQNLKNGVIDQAKAFGILTAQIDKAIESENKLSAIGLAQKFLNRDSAEATDPIDYIANWGQTPQWTGGAQNAADIFANQVKRAFDKATGTVTLGYGDTFFADQNYMSEELYRTIQNMLTVLENEGSDDPWGYIGEAVWRIMFGQSSGGKGVSDALKQELESNVDSVMSVVGVFMSQLDKSMVKQNIMESIIGDDNILSADEYNASFDKLSLMLIDYINNGVQSIVGKISNNDRFKTIIRGLFSDMFEGDIFDIADGSYNLFNSMLDDSQIVDWMVKAYEQALQAGFSGVDLKKLFSTQTVKLWGNASLGDLIGEVVLSNYDPSVYEDMFADISDQSLYALYQAFNQYGEQFPDLIHDIVANYEQGMSEADFVSMIEGIVGAQIELEEETESTTDTFDNYYKNLNNTIKGIASIKTAIESLTKGQTLSFDDIMDLSQAHPQIIQVINDADQLKEKLEQIAKSERNKALNEANNMLLTSSMFLKNSPFDAQVGDNYENLKQYLDTLDTQSDQYYEVMKYVNAAAEALVAYSEQTEQTKEEVKDIVEEMKTFLDEMKLISQTIGKIQNGQEITFSDLMSLADAHPQIMSVIGDIDALESKLKQIAGIQSQKVVDKVTDYIMGSEDVAKNSPFAKLLGDSKTLQEYIATLKKFSPQYEKAMEYINASTAGLLATTGQLSGMDKDVIGNLMTAIFGNSNADLLNRPVIDASVLKKAGWADAGSGIATVFSNTYSGSPTGKDGLKWNQNIILNVTPILENGEAFSPEALDEYVQNLLQNSSDLDELYANDELNLLLHVETGFDDMDEGMAKANSFMNLLHLLQQAYYNVKEEEKSWLEQKAEEIGKDQEVEWAKTNGFIDQLNQIDAALSQGGAEKAMEVWNSYDEKMQESIASTYPELIKDLYKLEKAMDNAQDGTDDLTNAQKKLQRTVDKTKKYLDVKYFKKTAAAAKELEEGTMSVADAYSDFADECDKAMKAQEDISDVQTKLQKGTEVTVSDVSNLADVLGLSAEQILSDFPAAVDMFNGLISQTGELKDALNALNEAAFIKIIGQSEADFSDIINGLAYIRADASATVEALKATGQWEVQEIQLPQNAKYFVPNKTGTGGKWQTTTAKGKMSVLVPKGASKVANGIKTGGGGGGSSSGGGGGGGGDDKKGDTQVEKMLDRFDQFATIRKAQQDFYSAQEKYYNQTGQLQGVIGYLEKEKEALEEENKVLEGNIADIERYMKIKQEELNGLSTTDDAYEEVADDLDKLQKAHQKYTKQLIDNQTSIEGFTESIKEQQKAIRDMVISIKDLIYKAIEDREKRTKEMLEGEIELQNEILDLITERYEKERDAIIQTNNDRIDALEKEKDLLSEQLQLRKKQAEEEDKLKQLAELEAKYAKISADPTRKKEALSILEDINDLREEIAWDTAEKEVEAQQEAIDQQITSLEDYIEYVENYYEDLFEHPQKLIEEMKQIIAGTDEQILAWLSENSSEFAKSTQNTQKKMIDSWQETINSMRGVIESYWEEVEAIYAQGDDYILNFLMQNSSDYAQAGKEQAEAYVDEWKDQLQDLKKALEEVQTKAASTYSYIAKAETSGSGSGGGGGSGGSGGSSGNKNTQDLQDKKEQQKTHGYSFTLAGKQYAFSGVYKSEQDARKRALTRITTLTKQFSEKTGMPLQQAETNIGDPARRSLKAYRDGGIADFTGPAWLDGTKQKPEAILNPYQTEIFKSFVDLLQDIGKIRVPSMGNYSNAVDANNAKSVSVGDIIVNVDNLDTDDDYETLAHKVSEVIMDEMGKGSVVGGIRLRSF